MTTGAARPAREPDPAALAALFDDMSALAAGRAEARRGDLPAEPLPSLLARCEAIAARPAARPTPLILCLPGVPALDPDWWRADPRVNAVALRAGDGIPVDGAAIRRLAEDRARTGQRLVLLADAAADLSHLAPSVAPRCVITCHPWLAWQAAGTGERLDLFCNSLARSLDRHPGLALVPAGAEDRPAAGRIAALLDGAAGSDDAAPSAPVATGYLGGAPAYEALCARLGYDPAFRPAPPRAPAPLPRRPLPPAAAPAEASWLVKGVAALPGTAHLAPSMWQMLPDIDCCVGDADCPERLDRVTGLLPDHEAALARLLVAAHFLRAGDPLQAMGQVAEAMETAPPDRLDIRQIGALLYAELGRPRLALDVLADGLAGGLAAARAADLGKAIHGETRPDAGQHGQALLIDALTALPPVDAGRRRLMVEIGTTREIVPGQGSTRQLALLCARFGIDFVTVDMDPANTRRAERMFARLDLPHRAVTAKGEDFLAAHAGPIDYVFLDAYDFDHGQHSETRQARYEAFLGERINDAACHQMHLDCAQSLLTRLAPDGLICFDDTWIGGNGAWTAKGKTAMPFLLANGFQVIAARNRAALLRRG